VPVYRGDASKFMPSADLPRFACKRCSFQPWFPKFDPNTMTTIITLMHVRLIKLPLHLRSPYFLVAIRNSIGHFIKVDGDQIFHGLNTFTRNYVKLDLNRGFPDKVFI